MESCDERINELHLAYCESMGLDNLELHIADERRWLSAVLAGLLPDDLKLLIHERRKGIIKEERRAASILVRNICGTDEAVADALNEVAVIRARMRVKIMDKGKASVLRATGRVAEVSDNEAKPVGELIQQLRKAAGE